MDERFPDEFVTWRHKTPVGVKVNEVFGMESKSGKVWLELARQIFCEQGEHDYRVIEHFDNGAPLLEGYPGRISITHTSHFFAAAILPKTPEVDLKSFSPRACMGIDAEPLDRSQVLKVREKFLSAEELEMIPENNLEKNIIAWTAKEALYKAALTSPFDYRNNIKLIELPEIEENPEVINPSSLGKAQLIFPSEVGIQPQIMTLFSYYSYYCCVTIAISPKAAKFGGKQ